MLSVIVLAEVLLRSKEVLVKYIIITLRVQKRVTVQRITKNIEDVYECHVISTIGTVVTSDLIHFIVVILIKYLFCCHQVKKSSVVMITLYLV